MGRANAAPPAMPTFSWMMLLPLVVVFVSKQIFDFENEEDVELCRTFYFISHTLVLATLGYLYTLAKANPQEGTVKTKEKSSFAATDDEPEVLKESTVAQYDVGQVQTELQRLLIGMCITSFLVWK